MKKAQQDIEKIELEESDLIKQLEEFQFGCDVKWKKNKFLQVDNDYFPSNEVMDLSIEDKFMAEHQAVLSESFSQYLSSIQKRLQIKLSKQHCKGFPEQINFKDLNLDAFLDNNFLLNNQERGLLKNLIKYNNAIFRMVGYVQILISSLYHYQLTLMVHIIYQSFQTLDLSQTQIQNQEDINQKIQNILNTLVFHFYQDQRISQIWFGKKGMLVSQLTKLINKWSYTMLSIQKGYFTNQFFHPFKFTTFKNQKTFYIFNQINNPRKKIKIDR